MHFQEGSRKKLILSNRGKGLHNGACVKQTSSEEPKVCSPIPKNAEFYLGDDQNLTSNTKSKYSEINNSDQKCEWKCEDWFEVSQKNGTYECLVKSKCSPNIYVENDYFESLCSTKRTQSQCLREWRDWMERRRCTRISPVSSTECITHYRVDDFNARFPPHLASDCTMDAWHSSTVFCTIPTVCQRSGVFDWWSEWNWPDPRI